MRLTKQISDEFGFLPEPLDRSRREQCHLNHLSPECRVLSGTFPIGNCDRTSAFREPPPLCTKHTWTSSPPQMHKPCPSPWDVLSGDCKTRLNEEYSRHCGTL